MGEEEGEGQHMDRHASKRNKELTQGRRSKHARNEMPCCLMCVDALCLCCAAVVIVR